MNELGSVSGIGSITELNKMRTQMIGALSEINKIDCSSATVDVVTVYHR